MHPSAAACMFWWVLLSALSLKTNTNIQSVITEHTWCNHSNGKVMCGNYLKYLSIISWHLATGNNKNLMWSVSTFQNMSPAGKMPFHYLSFPTPQLLFLPLFSGPTCKDLKPSRVSASMKDLLRPGRLQKEDAEINIIFSTFLKLMVESFLVSLNHWVSSTANNKACLVSIRVNITILPDYSQYITQWKQCIFCNKASTRNLGCFTRRKHWLRLQHKNVVYDYHIDV